MISGGGPVVTALPLHSAAVGAGNDSDSVFAKGSRIPMRIDRAKLNRLLIGWYVEFWKKSLRKLALEPMRVLATLKSALLKLPLVASAGLFLASRSHVTPNSDTSVGCSNRGISSVVNFRFETSTFRNAYRYSTVVNGVAWSVNCIDPS